LTSAEDSPQDAIVDLQPTEASSLRADVLEGLSRPQKAIPSKYLYDDEGSRLFDEITELPEYYPTPTEAGIFDACAEEMAQRVGPRALIIEPGAGNGDKMAALVEALDDPVAIVPIDISMDYVKRSAEALAARFPQLEVVPVCGDFLVPIDVPAPQREPLSRLVFFPGSTVGNFVPAVRHGLLRSFAADAGAGGLVLIGFDLKKDRETLEAAYDDSAGVTAAFNFNLLARLNRELEADFDPAGFCYLAEWNEPEGAVEMFLVSRLDQTVQIGVGPDAVEFEFPEGERIHTESSYKFDVDAFAEEAAACGLRREAVWTDADGRFAVMLLRA